MERIPDEPRQELLIALAGPAVTLAIVLVLLAILRLAGSHAEVTQLSEQQPFLAQLTTVNLYLLLFNLIPAFPMDGGRILRAALSLGLPADEAARTAGMIGQGCALVLGILGIASGQFLLVLVALDVSELVS